MGKGRGWARLCLMGLGLFVTLAPVWAQTVTPEDEYKKLIRVDQDIQPLGEHPFGANISLYNGSLSFQQTDVSLTGNGPLLQLSRTFEIEGNDGVGGRLDKAFGDWDIALPRIETLTAEGWFYTQANGWQEANGWQVNTAGDLNRRCANFAKPLAVTAMPNVSGLLPWKPATWWHGYHLVVPGHGSHDLLSNVGQDAAVYPAVTKNHWRIGCIDETTTANGKPGDGFIAQAPDGTRYWFNELVYRWAPTLERPLYTPVSEIRSPGERGPAFLHHRQLLARFIGILTGSTPAHAAPDHDFLQRHEAWMLVTKIEDRFGNTLTFNYDTNGQLTKIEASDGRILTIQRVADAHRIHTVTLQPTNAAPRVWTYNYDTQITGQPRLTSVALPGPDDRQWQFDLIAFDRDATLDTAFHSCITLGEPVDATWVGSITHPSGLIGRFAVHPVAHGRSDVPRDCLAMEYGNKDDPGSYAVIPDAWYSYTIKSKTFSGAGIPSGETWSYSYSPANASWADACASGCASTVWTQVRNPDGSSVKYTFSNRFDYTESQLLQTDYYSGDGTSLLRTVVNAYAHPTGQTWPDTVGHNLQSRINPAQTEQRSPLAKRVIHQAGDTYTWQAETFNYYAQVIKEKRFSSIGGSTCSVAAESYNSDCIESTQTYLNDTTNWVLGLPLTHTNLTTGEGVSENAYDSPNVIDRLSSRKRFGQPVMSYTWNAAGQLASFTDANGHTTTLSSYKRGIPQTIVYPETMVYDAAHPGGILEHTAQHLTVDDLGQITSITNQAGIATHYAYDAAGRLTQITYPSGWNPKTFAYTYVTSAERGLGANHWKRTVSQGNARHVTWYDAELRPVLTDTSIFGDSGSHISASTTYNWKGLATRASWPVSGSPALGSSALDPGTYTTYDALGRITAVSQHSESDPVTGQITVTTTKTAYLNGARKQVTDPAGHVTTTSYQVFDTPSYQAVTQVTAPEGIVQTITRNLYGAPTALTQSGPDGQGGSVSITKHLYYDAQHRLCRTEEPETGNTLLGYDAAGNLTWSAEGQTVTGSGCGSKPSSYTTRTYDAMNRLTGITYAGGQRSVTTAYNAMGQVKTATSSATNGSSTWSYTYDNLGHLSSEVLAVPSLPDRAIHYTYDASGSLSTLTYPDGKVIAYAPDALGRASKAGAYAYDVGYFPDGALASFSYGDGQDIYLIDRNARHLIKNLTVGSGSDSTALVYSQDFTYDKDANILTMTDLTPSGERSKALTYDALNRLIQAEAPDLWGTETYTYDALNNIRTLANTGIGGTYTHTYQYDTSNLLTAIMSGGTPLHQFTYDSQGDITQKDSQTRVFDAAHRLLQIPGVASYVYDAAGRRVQKTDISSGAKTYYAYNRAGQLLYQWDAAINTSTDYVYLGKKLVAEVKRSSGSPVLNAPGVSVDHNPNNGSYTVSWTATENVSYVVQEQVNGGSWHTILDGATTSKTLSGKLGGRYRYRVQVCDGDCSDWGYSEEVGVTPAKPTISIPSGIQSGRYTVSWNRPVSTTNFDVMEQANGGSWQTIANDTTATSISLPGDTSGSYAYQVRANNAYGTRGWAISGKVTVLLPPATAPSLNVPDTSSTGSYIVSWSSVVGATSYTLQQQVNGGSWGSQYNGSNRSKAYSGMTNGADYGYRVRACNASGCGPWSSTRKVSIAIPPAKPAEVYANERQIKFNMASLTVVWQGVNGASSYQVRNQSSGTIIWAGTGTSLEVDSGEPPMTLDSFAVRACNAWACSAWVLATRRQVLDPPPVAPSLSAPSGSESGSYTVSWSAVFNATSYTLQERINSGSWHAAYSGSGRSKAYSGKADGSYSYHVRACNSSGCSVWSTTKTVTVAKPPVTPTGLDAYVSGPSYKPVVYVSWNAVAYATAYQLEQTLPGQSPQVLNMGTSTSTSALQLVSGQITYRVRACNAVGCSPWSGYESVMVMAGSGPLLPAAEPVETRASTSSPETAAEPGDQS